MRRFFAIYNPFWALCPVLLLFAGCDSREIRSYRIPKEMHGAHADHNHEAESRATPLLRWQTPTGWQELPPSSMRVGSFTITGPDSQRAEVSVIPLSGLAGTDLDNVNRWRGQIGLEPVTESQLADFAVPISIAGEETRFFKLTGTGEKSLSILAAVIRRDGTAWFFKMTGDAALVANQQSAFSAFLQSVQFASGGTD